MRIPTEKDQIGGILVHPSDVKKTQNAEMLEFLHK